MNNANILLMDKPNINFGKSFSYHSNNRDFHNRSNFQHILKNQANSSQENIGRNYNDGIRQLKKLLNQIDSPSKEVKSIIEDLKEKLSKNTSIAQLVQFDESFIHKLLLSFAQNDYSFVENELSEEQIFQLIDELNLNGFYSNDEEVINFQSGHLIIDTVINGLSEDGQTHLQQLLQQITNVLSGLSVDDETIMQISGRLLSLLEQWAQLSKDGKLTLNESLINSVSVEELKLWEKLTNIFERRIAQQNKGNYQAEATVTRKDIAKWLEQLVSETFESKGQSMTTSSYLDLGRPMTQIEQYIVHTQPSDRVEKVSQELIQKMTQIIQQSKFTKPGSQIQQLSLMIRPENLGNMTLHFTQMNGDMVVKIIVSSQMAREMLESNIHQLKHLFAPHQVVIERDTTISDEQFFNKDYEEETSEHEETMDETKDERNHHEQENEQIDFESLLQMTTEGG